MQESRQCENCKYAHWCEDLGTWVLHCSRKVYEMPGLMWLNTCTEERRYEDCCGPEGRYFEQKKEE